MWRLFFKESRKDMYHIGDRIINLMHSCSRKFSIGTITMITKTYFEVTYDDMDNFDNNKQCYDLMYFEYIQKMEG